MTVALTPEDGKRLVEIGTCAVKPPALGTAAIGLAIPTGRGGACIRAEYRVLWVKPAGLPTGRGDDAWEPVIVVGSGQSPRHLPGWEPRRRT